MLDYLVIGAGIAGLSAAARLSELGGVMVVEAESAVGYHSSGRSAAVYEPDYGAAATVAVTRASGAELTRMGVMSPRGFLLLGGPDDKETFARDIETLHLTEIPVAAARDMVPILNREMTRFAAYTDAAKDIDTDLMLQSFLRQMRINGGALRTKAPVTAMVRIAGGWRVTAGGEVIEAARLVNAAGAWADTLARLAGVAPLGLVPNRRSMAVVPAPWGDGFDAWPMLMGAGETWYAKPQSGKFLVSPADEDPVAPHDAYADDMVLAEGLARYEAMVTVPVTRLEHSWGGLRTFAPDRALVLGPDPAEPAFLWCAGQGGQGFQSAPIAARVLAERAGGPPSGQPEAVMRALSPARLR